MSTNENNLIKHKYLIALSHFPKFGPRSLKIIKTSFRNEKDAFYAQTEQLEKAGIPAKISLEFTKNRHTINPDKIIDSMIEENISFITKDDPLFPPLLREISVEPQILFFKGDMNISHNNCLAIVGSRKITAYGKIATEKLTKELNKNGLTIVSGLALGIDTYAHNTCVDNHGLTIGVLGTGINKKNIYPSQNRYLAEKIIASGGLLISEFPLGTMPLKYNFPQRNRIISGLSLGTLVIEAAAKSGALITAEFALEQNRDVFAVPGNIFSDVSAGPNNLIKQGAKAITSAEEILEFLNLEKINTYNENKKILPETEGEKRIIEILSHEPKHIDEITRELQEKPQTISANLTMMEMKGLIKNIGGMNYVKIN